MGRVIPTRDKRGNWHFCQDCGQNVADYRVTYYAFELAWRCVPERYYCSYCLGQRARNQILRSWGLAVITKGG